MRDTATRWTLIGAARGGDAGAQRLFADKYRGPVLAYLRRRGLDADAEDVTQEVFLRLFRGGVLDRATESGGRFRDLLLAVTKHTLTDHWRAAGAVKRGGLTCTPLETSSRPLRAAPPTPRFSKSGS